MFANGNILNDPVFDRVLIALGIEEKHGWQAKLAKAVGVKPATVSGWKSRGVPEKIISDVTILSGYSKRWIKTGEGEMRHDATHLAIKRAKQALDAAMAAKPGGESQAKPPPGQPDRYRHLEAYRSTGPPAGISDEEWQLICNYRCAGDEIKEECFGMLERSAAKSRAKDGGGSDSPEMKSG